MQLTSHNVLPISVALKGHEGKWLDTIIVCTLLSANVHSLYMAGNNGHCVIMGHTNALLIIQVHSWSPPLGCNNVDLLATKGQI